ncbi:hypothetical protein [Amycolatopsis jiangsuensis]|uniref:Uncharacterized protein (AIM24 family) n=1 Tax=Amycolatopsis jiangsuensis TaxID=1181879 RepID=A0A840J1K1_9PSEU|nr:hypothetical protein [Amycolatopsis jiangsuensis]MBB4687940.1 uncharacterized protein (AIM24 family) [Amycolatopsis jiangsuensis]
MQVQVRQQPSPAIAGSVRRQAREVAKGAAQSAGAGEGLVSDSTGPGTVHPRTRNPSPLASRLVTALPAR